MLGYSCFDIISKVNTLPYFLEREFSGQKGGNVFTGRWTPKRNKK
jgi:hypothetical protein